VKVCFSVALKYIWLVPPFHEQKVRIGFSCYLLFKCFTNDCLWLTFDLLFIPLNDFRFRGHYNWKSMNKLKLKAIISERKLIQLLTPLKTFKTYSYNDRGSRGIFIHFEYAGTQAWKVIGWESEFPNNYILIIRSFLTSKLITLSFESL